ncbi:pyridoxal-phosphate-dependent aminotransferase family protein [Falsiroseomonas stagni]|uniref:Alanine-glyoxylate transaminase / serine-glyoxylate transaminase / serine-pyruvate transaminase n=1 Tax=Falsiroseomonas stagni DSM 19981 TaxID=1123062 RepID=A0A1I3Z4Q2_9PROT|nr:aminotransferase class V-fold PLP-dependent enzyme [Falsiroseomonas stagni]SFK38980.1 alanine-glyoxylate transaminase / serine-glyoxylate transaminase / serine-pyruvate transaminase [Falsiroseomonas stagni DSM 19981]
MAYFQSKPDSRRHFLHIPGPSNVPDRVLRAMDNPTMDHRGPDFGAMGKQLLAKVRKVFQTEGPVVIYPASGTGAWEAALVNTLSPGDRVLMCETGWFAHLWNEMAERLSIQADFIKTDWRRGADVEQIAERLAADKGHAIKAVCVVHNETSTGCTSRIDEVRKAIDAAGHPALLLVDTISSLGSMDYRHDEWGVDVTVSGSQKGLMLPPGLSFNAISAKAIKASETAKLTRSFWDWKPMLAANATGYFPYTPATNMLYALDTALDMLLEEGLQNVFARHDKVAEATRRAVRHWGFETQCQDPRHFSSVLTAVRLPEGHSANDLRATILSKFNMSLGNGLGQLNDRVFRIGHLGDISELQLVGALGGVEMGLRAAGIPHKAGGVQVAMEYLGGNA